MRAARPLLLLILTLLAAACDRAATITGPAELVGAWAVSNPAPEGAHTEQRMTFGSEGNFTAEVRWYGFYGLPADEQTGYMVSRGSYRLEGTTLVVRLTRQEQWQKYAVGENPSVETIRDPRWNEAGSVHVDGDRMTFTYVSAPADAPQVFTEEYRRVR